MTRQLERMETVFYNQNMILQHMKAMFNASVRTSPFESHSGLLRLEHHQIPKPRLSNLLHCYITVLQSAVDPVRACIFSNSIFAPN